MRVRARSLASEVLAPLLCVSLVVLALLIGGGCSNGEGGGDAGPDTSGGEPPPRIEPPSVPEVPDPPRPGEGTLVVGGTTSSFAVTICRLEPDPAAPESARALVELGGEGATTGGMPFTIELQRFATSLDEVVTYTDTLSYSDAGRILQAQRIEVSGQVSDLRDPDASTPLLRVRPDGVSAAGLAGAPGDGATDDGLVGLPLNATC